MEDKSLQEIIDELLKNHTLSTSQKSLVLTLENNRSLVQPNELLRVLSFYFNNEWMRTSTNEGFFLVKQHSIMLADGKHTPVFRIQSHKKIVLPGVVYFKSQEACKQAIRVFSKSYSIFKLY